MYFDCELPSNPCNAITNVLEPTIEKSKSKKSLSGVEIRFLVYSTYFCKIMFYTWY